MTTGRGRSGGGLITPFEVSDPPGLSFVHQYLIQVLKADRDNDLRTRIKKRAKSLYGDYHSNEKSAWVEQEYIKRRSKRESRARSTARRFKQFSGVSIHPDVRSTLFSPTNQDGAVGDPSLQHTGDLLLNALLCKGKRDGDHSIEFQRAIKNGSISPKSLDRAIRIIAQNPDIMQEIKTLLDDIEEDEGIDATSGEDNGTPPMQSTEMQPATAGHFPPVAETQSTDVIRALNAATALLNEMADTKVYVTPYANPPPRNVATNGALTVNGTDRKKTRGTTKQAMSGHGLDQSQIDALLALANGGSLTDDEDDLDEGQDTNGNSSDQPGPAQTDSAITATLQRIINHLMAERSGGIDRGLAPTSSLVEAYGSQAVRDQAATLQSLFSQAGVSINTIIPRAQSHATSQLYANLSTRARSSTPSGGINPAHAGSYGNTAQMQQRMLANPGIFAQAQHFQKRPLEAAKSSSRGNMVGLPVRASTPARSKNPEELRKIKTYGFPPLPGSRPGAKKT